jgi:osmoprotectant transport system substrate-binding protein
VKLRILISVALASATALTLAACSSSASGSGSAKAVDDKLKGASFTVSSKDFTESILLGKITGLVLGAHGATITDKTNIKGSVNTRTALTSGQVDMYWDYTGTGWITYLKNTKPLADPKAQYEAVKAADAKNGIAWLPPAPMNDTYAIATREGQADKLNVHSLSDLAALAKSNPGAATFCIESEFSTRDDGFPGMLKAYGIVVPRSNIKLLDTGVIYTETKKGSTCNFGEVFATDGRIGALKLTVLPDDQHFFPNYNAALTLKQSLLEKYPAISEYIDPVAAKLDDKTMTSLNAKVDAEGEDPGDVAKQWLQDQGLIGK